VSRDQRVQEGNAAIARGAWAEARTIFEEQLAVRESVDALEGLSWAAWWVEDVPTCIDARERAYRLSRQEGDMRRAAMLALWIADDYLILRGERAIANGWFQRAARILEALDTCPEHGWLDALLGYVATMDGDLEEAKKLAIQARELGRRLDVVSLEMFALAVEGLALVNEGEVVNGMRCLDEATVAALAGEFEEIVAAGWTSASCSTPASGSATSSARRSGAPGSRSSAAGCRRTSSRLPVGPTTGLCSPGTAAGLRPRPRSRRRSNSPSSGPPGVAS
jgi:tetratricopeptide (TPR) repeat protein